MTAAQQQLLETGMGPEEVLATLSKEDRKKVGKMQKKNNTMSLDQFNNQPTDSSSGQAKSEVNICSFYEFTDDLLLLTVPVIMNFLRKLCVKNVPSFVSCHNISLKGVCAQLNITTLYF